MPPTRDDAAPPVEDGCTDWQEVWPLFIEASMLMWGKCPGKACSMKHREVVIGLTTRW